MRARSNIETLKRNLIKTCLEKKNKLTRG